MSSSAIYRAEFDRVAVRAFAMWNRDPASPSFGSFDRAYWGWKFKDFSDATLQYAVKLAVEYAVRRKATDALPALLAAFVTQCRKLQHRDGSFDQSYPNEKTPGVVYDLLSTFIYVRESPLLVSAAARSDLDAVIDRAARFALATDETHGQIANHLAEYAYELLRYAAYRSHDAARARGEAYLARTLSLLDDEGWFREYEGPDPGYQTRTLRYIVKCAQMLDRPALWVVAEQAARFVEATLMPDGSIHPMLGTRSTALLYPSPFEALAERDASFALMADRIRSAWDEGLVPLASSLDFQNAIRLADDLLEAADLADRRAAQEAETPPARRAVRAEAERVAFPRAGLLVVREPHRVLYLAHHLGGAIVVYVKEETGRWKLQYEDSGYLLRDGRDGSAWLTRFPGSGRLLREESNGVLVEARFCRSLHDEVTPLRLVLLRVLNLTVLRWQWAGDLFRKAVVRRLMSGRRARALLVEREVSWDEEVLRIRDRLRGGEAEDPATRRGVLFACRRITGTHMASSRYFQDHELDALPLAWQQEVPWPEPGPEWPLRVVSIRSPRPRLC